MENRRGMTEIREREERGIPVLRAREIKKEYRLGELTLTALRGVSLSVFGRELIVILGPSGSGKSTMMNILGGTETASSGEVYYREKALDWSDQDALTLYRRKHVGFVFQFYNLLPGLTALENIQLAGELSEHPIGAEELLKEVGLSDRAYHFPNRLSGGEQQRIAIARALCKNPDILLCDEPTGALDSKTGIQVLRLIYDFSRSYQKPVVLITHNANIAKMADRVIYFKDGLIEREEGNASPLPPEEIEW